METNRNLEQNSRLTVMEQNPSKKTELMSVKGTDAKQLFTMKKVFLAAIIFLTAPFAGYAFTAAQLATHINAFAHGGTGELTASATGNIVYVDGHVTNVSVTDDTKILGLVIDPSVTIIWRATYTGASNTEQCLIAIGGSGLFQLVDGGYISDSGTGLGAIVVGTVAMTPTIEIIGGTVHATTSNAIFLNSNIRMIRGTVSTETGNGIFVGVGKNVLVKGGTVSATGDGGHAIRVSFGAAGNFVRVEDEGTVSATTGAAIGVYAAECTVEILRNCKVIATTGVAVGTNAANSTITVSGGEVGVTYGVAIAVAGANSSVTVSGGIVHAVVQAAIAVAGAGSTVDVNGEGFVFAHGTALTGEGNVINMVNGGTPTIEEESVVCAWNNLSTTYTEGSKTNLTVGPTGATAKWSREGDKHGISYANGANTGFFEISDVTVGTIGISEIAAEKITLYPNPTSGELRIESDDLRVEKIEIYDVQGRNVFSLTPEAAINVSHLPSGTYFVTLTTETEKIVKKIIKK